MDFSDPKNPKVAREFTGVTAMSRDDRRGLIFIANAEGIWILQQHLAEDPEVEKAYAHYVPVLRIEECAVAWPGVSILLFAHNEADAAHRVNKLLTQTDRPPCGATGQHGHR